MRVCVWFYCTLLCYVWLIYLGDLLFTEGKWRSGSGEERGGSGEGLGGEEGGKTLVRM